MKKLMICVILAICLGGAAMVNAQEKTKNTGADVTEYGFDDEVVDGIIRTPSDARINVRQSGPHKSLIKVRQHYIVELLKSVEEI